MRVAVLLQLTGELAPLRRDADGVRAHEPGGNRSDLDGRFRRDRAVELHDRDAWMSDTDSASHRLGSPAAAYDRVSKCTRFDPLELAQALARFVSQ